MAWQELIGDLRLNTQLTTLRDLNGFKRIYEQLKPGEVERWNELFLDFVVEVNAEQRQRLLQDLVESDYFKSIAGILLKTQKDLNDLRDQKKFKFPRN